MIDVVDESAGAKPYRAFLYFQGYKLLYDDFVHISDALSAGLAATGISRGDRVALVLPNCPQLILGLHAVWKAGAIAVPVNPYYTEHELELVFNEVGVKAVITLTPFYQAVKNVQPRTVVRTVIATSIKEYLPPHKSLLFSIFMEKEGGYRIDLQKGDLWFQELIGKHKNSKRPAISVSPADPAVILFSGGTTGIPMGAVGTHQSMVMTGMQIQAWLKPVLEEWDDRFLLPLPLYHVFGCIGSLGTAMINHSSCILVPDPRNMADVLNNIGKYKPAFMPGVSTFFINMMKHPLVRSGKVSLKSIKISIGGALPMKADLKKEFETLTGGRLIEGYAMTETMQAAALSTVVRPGKEGSVGLPLPDVIMRVMDAETGLTQLPPGQMGEICVKAPNLMMGYWDRPEETAGIMREGWLYTGDIGYMDKDGNLFLHSRKKEIIKTSGFQVWPREVEEVLQEHPAVMEAGVAGIPDASQGESVKAWVVLSPDSSCVPSELRDFCRNKLAAYKVPRQIEIRDSLPKSQVGKILRRVLIEEEHNDRLTDNNNK
jgi:long-chain acyl-CoA synthetase